VVVVLHGGPADVGGAAPLAHGLAEGFRVLEPWQRGSGGEPLTVARHVADLSELVASHGDGVRPALVGASWGAMLALAYAAAHPARAGPLVLVGCGTFDPVARARLRAAIEERTGDELRHRLAHLAEECPDPGDQLTQRHALTQALYTYAPIAAAQEEGAGEPFDVRAHTETWADMVRLQEAGVYPAAFAAITSPVLMVHGTYDPHPGQMIRASLAPYLPQLEYREWERCGHCPWGEQFVREEFFTVLREWLTQQLAEHDGGGRQCPVRLPASNRR
jgi:pimeloyl-ACP methyl ester carboxylesterase